jgi:uncharacterized protein YciI
VPRRTHLLTYAYVDGMAERREPHRAAHLALITAEHDAGRLVLGGAVGEPPARGLLAFASAADAERFVAADPYMAAGLVTDWSIQPWTLVVGLEDAQASA